MYTIIVFLIFIAFLFFYNTSAKTRWEDKPAWASYFEKRKIHSAAISLLSMVLASSMLVYDNGITSGIISFIVILMAMGSLIILVLPFGYLSTKHIALLFLGFILLEQLIF